MIAKLFNRNRIVLALALVGICMTAGLARAEERKPDCHMLSVGVDRYQSAKINDLNGCANDARDMASALRKQSGTLFGKVNANVFTNGAATKQQISAELNRLMNASKPGDYVVIFMSGHGSQNGGWKFLPTDYNPDQSAATGLSGAELLKVADGLTAQGRKVWVIVDACFAGQLRLDAKPILERHNNPNGGGMVLMVSSTATQTSTTLANNSAFALSIIEALSGRADFNQDGNITLREIRHYAFQRTHQLARDNRRPMQDGECDCSFSITENFPLGQVGVVKK